MHINFVHILLPDLSTQNTYRCRLFQCYFSSWLGSWLTISNYFQMATRLYLKLCLKHGFDSSFPVINISWSPKSFSSVFTNELSRSRGPCQLPPSWWSRLKNKIFDCSMTDPVPTYRYGLWVRILDRPRITLIMWNLRLLIDSKSLTNIKTCFLKTLCQLEMLGWREKTALIYGNRFSFLRLCYFLPL